MIIPKILTKKIRLWERKVTITKRQQFVVITFLLTLVLLLTQMVANELRYPMVLVLSVFTYIGAAVALREELAGVEWFTLLILPTLYTAAVALFYFLLPVRWLTRLPVLVLYSLGMYALLLTENIYNVAANRSISLLRAAHSVGFLLTLLTCFFLTGTVFSLRSPFYITALVVGGVSGLLIVQSLWAITLESHISEDIKKITIILMAVFSELAWIFSFWPIKNILISLFLTTVFYSTVGMAQQYLVEKLYKKTVIEFTTVTVIVFVILIFATHWRGNF